MHTIRELHDDGDRKMLVIVVRYLADESISWIWLACTFEMIVISGRKGASC